MLRIFFSLKNRFAECNSKNTRQTVTVCWDKKNLWKIGLPSVIPKNTRQTIILCRVYFGKTLGKPLFFCRVSNLTLGKPFVECAIKNTWQISVCRHCRCRVLFVKCYTRQSLCRVFFDLSRVHICYFVHCHCRKQCKCWCQNINDQCQDALLFV